MAQVRKTAKYYREIFANGSISQAVKLLPEVIKKFGSKRWSESKTNDRLYLRHYTKFEWNHQIVGFFLTNKGVVCADIYWQGDSTDGNASEYAEDLIYGKVIRGEYEWIGDRTYERHSDLRISRDEFANAIRAVAKYLSPEAIKERKAEEERADKCKAVFDMLDAKKKGLDRWEMENFWNGRIAVQRVLEQNPQLYELTLDQLKGVAEKVYNNNFKTDYSLRGGWCTGEKKYNLAY
jgi:hypothetical protein